MKVAIIGAGNVGRALATSATRAGHEVTISASHAEHAREAASQTGATAAASNRDGVQGADVVILAVPATALDTLADELADVSAGKPIVDVSNRPTPDPAGRTDVSMAESLQSKLPRAHVVKAFNTIFASRQADPVVEGFPLDGLVAGDEPAAKARVLELVRSLGFRPIDAGNLVMARTLEAMAWLNISLNMENKWPWQAGWKLVGPSGE